MQVKSLIALTVSAALLAACQQPGQRPGTGALNGGSVNKQDIGTVAGAIGGGVIGSTMGRGAGRTAATIGGALIGGMIGNNIGQSLDSADMAAYNQTSQRALNNGQNGQSLPWKNPQTGNSGTITPTNYYQNDSGEYCREYSQTITVGGKKQEGHGTACRQPDGSWRIVE